MSSLDLSLSIAARYQHRVSVIVPHPLYQAIEAHSQKYRWSGGIGKNVSGYLRTAALYCLRNAVDLGAIYPDVDLLQIPDRKINELDV